MGEVKPILSDAFERLGANLVLFLYPVVLDLLVLAGGIGLRGFYGQSKTALKLTLNVGLPSINQVVDQNGALGNVQITPGLAVGGWPSWLVCCSSC